MCSEEAQINASDNRVGCGVALVLTHGRRVLFGKRVDGPTAWQWQLPGGWIAVGESPIDAALRELREETGLEAREPRFIGLTSNRFAADRQSISLYFEAQCVDPARLDPGEPGKCLGWEWLAWEEVGENLYLPLRLLRETGYRPFLDPARESFVSI